MKKSIFLAKILYSFLILFFANPLLSNTINKYKGNLKILVLIIASDQYPVYTELQKIWRSYMHLDPNHVEAYFIKGDPELPATCDIVDDVIWSNVREGWDPESAGIINKTVLSMELLLPRIKTEFDYVLRTNLSSFYIFSRLLEQLEHMPRNNFYYGTWIANGWISCVAEGCGYVLSSDLVEKIVEHKSEFIDNVSFGDDVLIGLFLKNNGINVIHHERLNFFDLNAWNNNKNNISDHIFMCRVKNFNHELRATDDIIIHSQLLKMFYQ